MKYPTLLLTLFLLGMIDLHAQTSPDSLFTDEYITSICIDEPQRALRLLDEAERDERRPLHRINYLRCLTYNNGLGQYRIALDFARKAYQSDSVKNNPEQALYLLDMMASECCDIGDYPECVRYSIIGAEIARKTGNKSIEANLLRVTGTAKREMGLKEEADSCFLQAIDIQKKVVKNSQDWGEVDDLIYSYGTLITAYQEDGKYQKAIDLIPEYERLMEKLKTCPNLPEGVVDVRYASEYAAFACIFAQNGEPEKARHYYRKYLETDYASMPEGESIRIDYLLNAGQYREALLYIEKEKQRLVDNEATTSYAYLHYALEYEAKAYMGLQDYQKAAESYRQMLAVTDSLNADERQNMALELASIYETNEKNEQIREQSVLLHQTQIILWAVGIGLFLSVIIIWLVIRNLHTIRMKNRVLVKQIDELLIFRDELSKAKELIRSLTPADKKNTVTETTLETEPHNRELFEILDTLVNEEQLFLEPDINRDMLIQQTGIPKNSFPQLLQNYAYTNFNGYINNKRLEYSIPLLRDTQNYTIQAVALDSGFNNVRTYNRVFHDKFGITPSEYRENMNPD